MKNIQEAVKEKYGAAARNSDCRQNRLLRRRRRVQRLRPHHAQSCTTNRRKAALPADAVAASLGCGNPTALAELKPGEMVLDLGSGGGIDVLLSAKRVGPTAKRTAWT